MACAAETDHEIAQVFIKLKNKIVRAEFSPMNSKNEEL